MEYLATKMYDFVKIEKKYLGDVSWEIKYKPF